ncbi:MAG: hypothetical protein ACXWL5_02520 [Candidatus Chromulinivorax sp.]
MNIRKKVILLSTITLLSYNTYNMTFWGDDNFTQEIMQDFYNLQQKINNSMNRMFHDVQVSTSNLQRQFDQKNCTNSQCKNVQYYQQSSSSMSFANNEKAIRIATEKNNDATTYTIDVTDKVQQKNGKDNDSLAHLKTLIEYVKEHFSSHQAIKTLHECINILEHEQKNKMVSFNQSKEANHTQYVISIQDKKENSENKESQEEYDLEENEEDGYEDKLDSRKKKSSNRFKQNSKKVKNN